MERREPAFSVFLDANVIRGIEATDIILTLAGHGMFTVRWSDHVIEEARRNRPAGLPLERFDARVRQMNAFFPHALVADFDHLTASQSADPKDRPVLAAAVHAGVTVLVTENLKDFWPGIADGNTTLCASTSDLLCATLRIDPRFTIAALTQRLSGHRRPPNTFPEFLDFLATRPDLAQFAKALNHEVVPAMRGSDPRLRDPAGPPRAVVGALAGTTPLAVALRQEQARSARYPRARRWASQRGGRSGGIER